jgi:hypothetical protein
MNNEMNNRLTRYEISNNREEIKALKLALFAFRMEFVRQNKKIDENSIEVLTDRINSSSNKLWLDISEIRTLVQIYSRREFNNTNPFVRKTVDIARKHLPEDIYKITSGVQRSMSARPSLRERSKAEHRSRINRKISPKTIWSNLTRMFDKLINFKK